METIIPAWLCIPFAGLLLCIAVMPLVKATWWEKNQPLVVAMWSLLFVIPYAVKYGVGDSVETVLECVLNDYLISVSPFELVKPFFTVPELQVKDIASAGQFFMHMPQRIHSV